MQMSSLVLATCYNTCMSAEVRETAVDQPRPDTKDVNFRHKKICQTVAME